MRKNKIIQLLNGEVDISDEEGLGDEEEEVYEDE